MRRFTRTLLAAVLLLGAGATHAFSQGLDGIWLRLNVSANGLQIDLADDSVRRNGVFRGKCYMRIAYDAAGNVYTGRTACEIAKNAWSETADFPTFSLFSDDGGSATVEHASYTNRLGGVIEGDGTHLLTPSYNRKGVLKKVHLASYGELNGVSSLKPGMSRFLGGYRVVGLSLPERRVPAAVVAALTPAPAPAPTGPPPSSGVAAEILTLVNARRAAGATCGAAAFPPVGPLSLDARLSQAADVHALDMATNNFFSHTGSDGSSPFDRIAAAGFSGGTQGENIAAGYPTAADAVDGWMGSDGHCRNIMNAAFTLMGGGHAFDAGSDFGNYWVQTFGSN